MFAVICLQMQLLESWKYDIASVKYSFASEILILHDLFESIFRWI